MIWVPSDIEAWEPAQLTSSDAKSITARLRNGKEVKFPGAVAKFDPIPAGALDEGCENLVNLESFCEGIILHHIKKRYYQNIIYTFVGNILVALNPYRTLDIYGPAVIDKIFEQTKYNETVPPHVYSIGAAAVYNMRRDLKDQSVLISGESGAGKTEATKKILQFISTVSGSTASRSGHSVENQILDSNPLLESFGNAKTIRNNNSSRFGKYMEVNFDKKNNIKGCNIVSYLLEKSRVVKQGLNERNYHVFYMLLAGAKKEMKKDFALKPPDQFWYLGQSGCFEVDKRSDTKEFEEMVAAMNNLAITSAVQTQIFQCLAGILHLGNLSFVASREVEGGCKAAAPAECRRVAGLLGINPDALERALCFRETLVNGESTMTPLSPEKAVDLRDALSKYVYGKVFDHVVKLVNGSLFRGKVALNIGVLDIFGFEVFKVNSFEQLCINYCNERLQTFFNEIIFEGEIKTYQAEDLPIDDIAYVDNMGCVRLIDQRGAGIFDYLNEMATVPNGTDQKFVAKINQVFDDAKATKSEYFSRNKRSPLEFTVKHFAGDVGYNATDFLEKNRDALAEALLAQMQSSTIDFLHNPEPEAAAAAGAGAGTSSSSSSSRSKSKSKATLCTKFKADLDSLMANLRQTVPHFVRCVKPNEKQAPNLFDSVLTLNQLKYSGLFEAIRIRKAGYAVRLPIDGFIKRFAHCCLNIPAEVKKDPKQHVMALLTDLEMQVAALPVEAKKSETGSGSAASKLLGAGASPVSSPAAVAAASKAGKPAGGGGGGGKAASGPGVGQDGKRLWVVGKTKVFIRTQSYKYQLEDVREKSSTNLAIPIQSIVRRYIQRCRYIKRVGDKLKVKEAIRKLESGERKRMQKEDELSFKVEEQWRNDYALQKRLAEAKRTRMEQEKKRIAKLHREAATKIQTIVRGKLQRTFGRTYMCEKMLEMALLNREEAELRRAIVMPQLFNVTSKLIRVYQSNAKTLILAMLNESYVTNQISEAIQINSMDLLKDAMKLAVESNMMYLPIVAEAERLLNNSALLRAVLGSMSSVLSRCVTVPKLLFRTDLLELLVMQATRLGLAGEPQTQDCVLRLHRIKNLIILRDRLRFALEVCSPGKMQSAITERAKLVRIYGAELCIEEVTAIQNMYRMLNFQASVAPESFADGNDDPTVKELKAEHLAEMNAAAANGNYIRRGSRAAGADDGVSEHGGTQHSLASSTASKPRTRALSIKLDRGPGVEYGSSYIGDDPNIQASSTAGGNNKVQSDLLLPMFVSRALERIRDAHSPSEIIAAENNFIKVVPVESKRIFYARIFKWVVSFATWKYPKRLSNEAIAAAKTHCLDMNLQTDAYTLLLVADTVGEVSSIHSLLSAEADELDKRFQEMQMQTLEMTRNDTTSSFTHTKGPGRGNHGHGASTSGIFSPGSTMKMTAANASVRFDGGSPISPGEEGTPSSPAWNPQDYFINSSRFSPAGSMMITGAGMQPENVPQSNRTAPHIKSHTHYISPAEVSQMQQHLKMRGTDSPRVMKKMSAMRARTLMNAGLLSDAAGASALGGGVSMGSGAVHLREQQMMGGVSLSASGAMGAFLTTGGRSGSPHSPEARRQRASSPTGGRLSKAFFSSMDQSASTRMANGTGGTNNYSGPYAQRQSKSQVAAHQMIKKGKKINYEYLQHKTDRLISNEQKNLAEFVNKAIVPKSTF